MDKLNTFGFTATQAAADFVAAIECRFHAAMDAGFALTPAPAYAFAGQKRGIIRD